MSDSSTSGPSDVVARAAVRARAEEFLATARQARAAYHQLQDRPGYNAEMAMNLVWEAQFALLEYLNVQPGEPGDLAHVKGTTLTSTEAFNMLNFPGDTDTEIELSDEFVEAFMGVLRRCIAEPIDLPGQVRWERGLPEIIGGSAAAVEQGTPSEGVPGPAYEQSKTVVNDGPLVGPDAPGL